MAHQQMADVNITHINVLRNYVCFVKFSFIDFANGLQISDMRVASYAYKL